MSESWSSQLLATRPRQPNQVACGATCLVVARALKDAGYAELLMTGRHPRTGYELDGDPGDRFAAEVRRTHRRITSPVDLSGRWQPPWPRRLGTPPWAIARELSAGHTRYWARSGGHAVVSTLAFELPRRPAPLYIGTRRAPRHVVLAVDVDVDTVVIYEPSAGELVPVPLDELHDGRIPLAGWSRWWWAILP